jgi:N4-gp56 family major capsid protein
MPVPSKVIPAANAAGLSGNNVDLLPPTSYAGTVASDSALRTEIWSELVTRDAREKNVLSKFIGGEGSGNPIVEKRDLSAGGSDKVTFTTVAPIRGQGVRAEEVLKNSVGQLKFGTFNVEVDLMRHAVAWTQVLKLMRFTGKTLDQISAEVMSEWAGRTEQDHIQAVLRDSAGTSNSISGYGSGASGALQSDEGFSTDLIQEAKQSLIANGGQPMNTGADGNQEIPGYLFFAPDAVLRSLRSDPDYMEAILYADSRGEGNKLYSGNYAKWDNNIIANHNVIIDTAEGRQGSPLAPTAIATAAVANITTATAGAEGSRLGGDAWANFKGFDPNIPGGGGKNFTVTGGGNVLAVRPNKSWTLLAYTGNQGTHLTGVSVVTVGNVANSGGTPSNQTNSTAFTAGTMFYQANAIGTPIGYVLAMGEGALYYAKGAVVNEQIYHADDFANASNDAHLTAIGVQSVYGMAAYEDTNDRMPGFQLIESVRTLPGFVW